MNDIAAISVTQLNGYIKLMMDNDDFLSSVAIRGEISNFKRHTSGHLYFTLKDERSEISAIMFRSAADRLTFAPKSGMTVILYGKVSVYEATGKYQIYVSAMTDDGIGEMYRQFLLLKAKLEAEGLFASDRKRPLPTYPKRIGVVTSPTGAAIRDIINVTGRRFPTAELLISPALVQGAEAPASLCAALELLIAAGECDVIIIGRGGGSAEDLFAFNDESLVRAVAACPVPIISAVGHETDTTLCDYAADLRAPTPSAAAETSVPDRLSLMQGLADKEDKLDGSVERILASYEKRISDFSLKLDVCSPMARLENASARINNAGEMLDKYMSSVLERKRLKLASAVGQLEGVNPLAVINRGYSMTLDENGKIVSSVGDVSAGDGISVRVKDGSIVARVESKTEEKNVGKH